MANKNWKAENSLIVRRNQEFTRSLRSKTVCQRCGKQPIDWHRKEHEEHPEWRVSSLSGNTYSLQRILAEIERCEPLCRRCHMLLDGRIEKLTAQAMANHLRVKPIRMCVACGGEARPSRKGMCGKCYDRQRVRKGRVRKKKESS